MGGEWGGGLEEGEGLGGGGGVDEGIYGLEEVEGCCDGAEGGEGDYVTAEGPFEGIGTCRGRNSRGKNRLAMRGFCFYETSGWEILVGFKRRIFRSALSDRETH